MPEAGLTQPKKFTSFNLVEDGGRCQLDDPVLLEGEMFFPSRLSPFPFRFRYPK
jgi:hypothetical protein